MVALNQTYKQKQSFEAFPELQKLKEDYDRFCLEEVGWHKTGRSYDCAISLHQVNFEDKIVAEFGARDSVFCSYLTKMAKEIHVSDTFIGWGDLGDINYWCTLWKKFAPNPERLRVSMQDMTSILYPDNFFDVVVSFSAIEHIPGHGDIDAAQELARVCKPGGFIIIGTEVIKGPTTRWASGSYFYTEDDLFDRIIEPTGCALVGDHNFSYEDSEEKIEFAGVEFSSCIFILQKDRE